MYIDYIFYLSKELSLKLINDSVSSSTKCNMDFANRVIEEHKGLGED